MSLPSAPVDQFSSMPFLCRFYQNAQFGQLLYSLCTDCGFTDPLKLNEKFDEV